LARLTRISESERAWAIASVHAYRGEVDEAIAWLERAYQQRDYELLFLKGDPFFRALQDDPRYKAFCTR